jgi:tetratricopeptide (TPR) repeat protein
VAEEWQGGSCITGSSAHPSDCNATRAKKSHRVWYALGVAYAKLRQYQESITAYQQAIRLGPTFAYSHNGLGNVYRVLKRYDEALAAYQQAIRLDPTLAILHVMLGALHNLQHREDKAQAEYVQALEFDPQAYSAMICLARIERQQGNQAKAMSWIHQARSILHDDDFYSRACLESVAGNADAAIEALLIALEHSEESVEWGRDDPDFVFIRDDSRYRALVGLDDDARDG